MTRINFEVDEKQAQYIDELVDQTGLKTKVNLFNTALTLFEWAVRERQAGRAICSQDVNTAAIREIEMPGLPQIKRPAIHQPVSEPARRSTRSRKRLDGSDESAVPLHQLFNLLSSYAETPQQAKEVVDAVKAFGAEIKPEAQEKLRAMINPK
jgi:hypothetical protein